MPEAFTIQGFASKGSKPNPHGGVLHKWEVSLTDGEGVTHHDVYWQSKSDELHIGQEVYGEISDGDYGPRFRTAQREDGAPRASQSGSGGRRDDPERSRRIERQHSQHMALLWLGMSVKDGDPLTLEDEVRHAIDWFQQDLDADVGGGASQNQDEVRSSERHAAADVSADNTVYRMEHGELTPVVRTPEYQEASTAQKQRLTREFNRLQLAREAQKAIVLYRCRSEKATKDGASQLIKDITEGATADSLLAEISDGRRAGNPLAARAAALIPTDVPNAEPEPEYTEEDKKHDDDIPF